MIVTKKDSLWLIENYQDEDIHFKFFYPESFTGLSTLDTYIKRGCARIKEEPFEKLNARILIREEFDSIAYFMDNKGNKIAEREMQGSPMIALDESYFTQDAFSQRIEDEILAEKTGREVFVSEMSEGEATALMKGFAQHRKNIGNN